MKFGLFIYLFCVFSSLGFSQYTPLDDQGGKIFSNVHIQSVTYFSDTSFGNGHQPGQFQIQTDIPGYEWLLTSPSDISNPADIKQLYNTLLAAFMSDRPVLLNIKLSPNNIYGRWYIRAVQILKG